VGSARAYRNARRGVWGRSGAAPPRTTPGSMWWGVLGEERRRSPRTTGSMCGGVWGRSGRSPRTNKSIQTMHSRVDDTPGRWSTSTADRGQQQDHRGESSGGRGAATVRARSSSCAPRRCRPRGVSRLSVCTRAIDTSSPGCRACELPRERSREATVEARVVAVTSRRTPIARSPMRFTMAPSTAWPCGRPRRG